MIAIVKAMGLVTLQDLGTHGHMHEGVPPGGALVPALLVSANRAACNADDALGLEVMGSVTVQAQSPITIADRDGARLLRTGEEHTITSEPLRVAYLAVRGGFAGRAALLCANGRRLGRGDTLEHAAAPETDGDAVTFDNIVDAGRTGAVAEVRVVRGPDDEAFADGAFEALLGPTYTIAPSSDRAGTRLVGPRIARRPDYRAHSRPMVIGALEVPGDGAPIVLGPEGPVTGGYPILAVVSHADLGRFFAVRLGGSIRFIA